MKVAFYAPMKSPDSVHPSGDRTIGRLLMSALSSAHCDVRLASKLGTWSASPSPVRLAEFDDQSRQVADALVADYSASPSCADSAGHDAFVGRTSDQDPVQRPPWRPDVWLTYHNYYKAPDLLGPRVARELGIPYVIVEASYAKRRAETAWGAWLLAASEGIKQAEVVLSFTERDRVGLTEICAPDRLVALAPFIDLSDYPRSVPPRSAVSATPVRLVCVAMMRPGAKALSYQLLADALARRADLPWQLDIVGDGTAGNDIEQMFANFVQCDRKMEGRITFHGVLDAAAVRAVLLASDVFVWPGIDEAFGMVYLEAQAAGLSVAALRTAGVPEVVCHQVTGLLADPPSVQTFADCLARLIDDRELRLAFGLSARRRVEDNHSIAAASQTLVAVLDRVVGRDTI